MDAEMIADRRRLRRKLSFWRVLAVLGLIAAVVAAGLTATRNASTLAGGSLGSRHIARISVDGFIAGNSRMADLMKRVGEASNVAGVVIAVDSPGGTTTGAEELYRNIRQLAGKKPVVAFVDGTAASGGYITALGADRIVARETSLVGSIGVLFQYPDVSGLLQTVGVKVEEIKSAPLKAEPSPFKPTSPEGRAALQQVVADTYEWFKGIVRDRRALDEAQLAQVATGQVFNGRQSLPLKLVDEVGGEREAIAWMERERGVAANLPVRDWKPRNETDFTLFTWAALGASLLGLEETAEGLRRLSLSAQIGKLDGLLAVWHPSVAEK
ncbi:MAG TPA: signal peptide peptidase SppA [Microvirga sp.]|jgi:protease-4|nr:signal peptide peptidase SppA [Microvirga sp.]